MPRPHPIPPPTGGQVLRPDPHDLAEALNRAVRHGRPDLARRLADRLAGPDRQVRTYALGISHRSGGA